MIKRLVLTASFLALLALSIYVQFLGGAYGDKQWEMLYAQKWLNGARFYSDLFTVAPPLIYWMYGVPALMAKLAGQAQPFFMLVITGLALIAASIAMCMKLMAKHPGFGKPMRWQFAALLAFVLVFRTSPLFFLDREHLFLVLILPFMVRTMPSLADIEYGKGLRFLIGVMAGVGFCIKPYCLVVWAGIMLLTVWRQRSPRALISLENMLIYAVGIAYLLLVRLLYPEYYTVVVPMALASYSATRDATPVLDYTTGAVSSLLFTFLLFRWKDDSPYRRDIWYFAALCPFFLAYALLNNNWAYTYLPLSSAALIVTGFVLWEFISLRAIKPGLQVSLGIALCLGVFAFKIYISLGYFAMVLKDDCRDNIACMGDDVMAKDLIAPNGKALSFGSVSIDFSRWTRLEYYTGAPWVTRFSQLWMLPRFLVADKDFERAHRWILTYVAEGFADDLNRKKPQVLFVDDTDVFYTVAKPLDLVGFFSADPDFRAAFSHYRFVHRINLCAAHAPHKFKCSYFVFRRGD